MEEILAKKRIRDLETLVTLSLVFLAFYLVFKKNTFVFLAFILLLVCLVAKGITSIIADFWLNFSHLLGKINTKIILFISFYVLVTPLSFVYRICVRNPLFLKKERTGETYFYTRNHLFKKEEFYKTW